MIALAKNCKTRQQKSQPGYRQPALKDATVRNKGTRTTKAALRYGQADSNIFFSSSSTREVFVVRVLVVALLKYKKTRLS